MSFKKQADGGFLGCLERDPIGYNISKDSSRAG